MRWVAVALTSVAVVVVVALLASGVVPARGSSAAAAKHAPRVAASGEAAGRAAGGTATGATTPAASAVSPGPVTAARAADDFLDTSVDADGRVVRHDQGGDTVSEGQAYALLLATSRGRHDQVRRVWAWTQAHLRRSDGLLSWHWSAGSVVDPNSAADADLLSAAALVQAGQRFDDASLRAAGLRLGTAVLDHETALTPDGRVLLAGSWVTGAPWRVDPSYGPPFALDVLAAASPDPRWGQLRAGDDAVLRALLADAPLPPDWAQVGADGTVSAVPDPGGAVAFGLDAQRVVVQLAGSCSASDRALAARTAPALLHHPAALRGVLDLGGTAEVSWSDPLVLVAAAAAASATARPALSSALLSRAGALEATDPTYYGAAWVALGSALLAARPAWPSTCPTGRSSPPDASNASSPSTSPGGTP